MTLPEFRTVDELGAAIWPGWDAKKRRRWIYRQVEERGMPVIRLGRQVIFETSAVTNWFADQRVGSTNGAAD